MLIVVVDTLQKKVLFYIIVIYIKRKKIIINYSKPIEFENKKDKIKAHQYYKNQYLSGSGRMAEAIHLAYTLKI